MNAIAVRASPQKALRADATVGVIVREEPVLSLFITTNGCTSSADQFSSCIVILANGLVSLHQQWLTVVSLA